ncbi:MAG: hypothetical protein RMJ53_04730, partial [Chitinophagales bacterium]|nr:hypothetical protein [Chitinophagales bacterium]
FLSPHNNFFGGGPFVPPPPGGGPKKGGAAPGQADAWGPDTAATTSLRLCLPHPSPESEFQLFLIML